jgi:hypothetical protein
VVPEANIYKSFNDFYHWLLEYNLINQWIVDDGPFDLDFTWMHPLYNPSFTKPFADKAFKDRFGVSLDEFTSNSQ